MLEALEILELKQDLTSFGLNPQDWRITPKDDGYFKIESDGDKDFIFLGTSKNKKWERIEFVSL